MLGESEDDPLAPDPLFAQLVLDPSARAHLEAFVATAPAEHRQLVCQGHTVESLREKMWLAIKGTRPMDQHELAAAYYLGVKPDTDSPRDSMSMSASSAPLGSIGVSSSSAPLGSTGDTAHASTSPAPMGSAVEDEATVSGIGPSALLIRLCSG